MIYILILSMPLCKKSKKEVRQFYIQFVTSEIKSSLHNNFDHVKANMFLISLIVTD
jgi:hypothetical protein